ncbi:hypothetical protein PUN28_015205 [Cardiocondyla obscurior]|uniref:Uncharacterized protein n=1 Tax=Cardiocondyla obscurior TaxID=286306 RepID=A0AAW2F100_9HYME
MHASSTFNRKSRCCAAKKSCTRLHDKHPKFATCRQEVSEIKIRNSSRFFEDTRQTHAYSVHSPYPSIKNATGHQPQSVSSSRSVSTLGSSIWKRNTHVHMCVRILLVPRYFFLPKRAR